MLKKLSFLVLGFGLVVAGIFLVIYLSFNSIVKTAFLHFAPKILGVPVELSSVRIMPFSGEGQIRGLKIGNPHGGSSKFAVEVERAAIAINLSSLSTKKIYINNIEIDRPVINYEGVGVKNNFTKLQNNSIKYTSTANSSSQTSADSPKLLIRRFIIRNIQVNAYGFHPTSKSIPVQFELAEINLSNIDMSSPEKLTQEILAQISPKILSSITRSIATKPIDIPKNLIENGAKGVKDLFR